MANWCLNTVEFKGERVSELIDAFKDYNEESGRLIISEVKNGLKTKIKEINDLGFVDIQYWDEGIGYYSKWKPNIDDLILISKEYKVDFEVHYEESNDCLVGRGFYNHTTESFKYYELTLEEYESISYLEFDDEEEEEPDTSGECMLDGVKYRDNTSAWRALLDRKIVSEKRLERINMILTPKRRGKQKKPTKADIIDKLFEFDAYKSFSFSKLNRKRKKELALLLFEATEARAIKIAA